MKKWTSALALASLCIGCGDAPATDGAQPETAAAAEAPGGSAALPKFREITLPEGTQLRLRLRSAVASDANKVEDTVRAELREAVTVDGTTAFPAGAELSGVVTDVERSGRVKGRARIAYRFNILNHAGDSYDVATAAISHLAEATKGEDATKIAIGAGAGAAIGAVLGGGSGAAKGAVIGGAAGTGAVLATRGEEVRLGPGASVNTRLTAPLTVRVAMDNASARAR